MEESYLVKTKDIKFNKTLFDDKGCASEVGVVLCIAETKLLPFKLKKPNNENVVYNTPFQTQILILFYDFYSSLIKFLFSLFIKIYIVNASFTFRYCRY